MADDDELRQRFRDFSATAAARAPLYSRLSAGIAEDDPLVGLLGVAPREQQIPVMLFAAVHFLLLGGSGPALAAHYPNLTAAPVDGDPLPAFRAFALAHTDELSEIISTHATQTNEVGRCAQFVPAFGLLADEVGPLAHLDVGCSAGLNLLWPRYAYDYRPGGVLGDPSPVHLTCATRGDVPLPRSLPPLARSLGLDRAPVAIDDEHAVRWLEACVWPDQADRFRRLVAAVDLARADRPEVRTGDAVTDVAAAVREMSGSGHPVVTTSWVLSYLTTEQRVAFVDALDDAGRTCDLSWIVAESPAQTPGLPVPTTDPPEQLTIVALARWRQGLRTVTRLATSHPHGFWMHWEGAAGT